MNMKGIESLKVIRRRNINRIVIRIVKQNIENVDMIISKIDSSFLTCQFLIDGFIEPFGAAKGVE